MLAGSEFQSLGRAIVKEDEYEEVRWDGIVVKGGDVLSIAFSAYNIIDQASQLWMYNESFGGYLAIIVNMELHRYEKYSVCGFDDSQWPSVSPDFTASNIFLWEYLKTKLYARRLPDINSLINTIREEIAGVMPDTLQGVITTTMVDILSPRVVGGTDEYVLLVAGMTADLERVIGAASCDTIHLLRNVYALVHLPTAGSHSCNE
ncbi:hypothetical protein ANN_18209 [Periplaneta americana]|uniref:Uncharacterized protein n=1 Tax=Periplaneta americana TaxID=6978 RepID=A0ABQ8SNM0_PERAM|nr:hypothetical protein ANN_18209 [Periplaneta americana]